MTEYGIDTGRIAEILAELEVSAQRHRLEILKRAVVAHGGRWDLPSDVSGIYEPALLSLQVFGVHAMAETLDELPHNWMQAAANILEGGPCRWSEAI
ncbi:hypothetical protein [Profundibacter sp.]|uniref:hypothetical protein n=1 Tax=Profundibacter sp. TaxID=3101071 RepID=UPI003D0DBCB3